MNFGDPNLVTLALIVALFLMSLFSAVILFKFLDSQANVQTPVGKFGGALAGFIGVFYMLLMGFQQLNMAGSGPKRRWVFRVSIR